MNPSTGNVTKMENCFSYYGGLLFDARPADIYIFKTGDRTSTVNDAHCEVFGAAVIGERIGKNCFRKHLIVLNFRQSNMNNYGKGY